MYLKFILDSSNIQCGGVHSVYNGLNHIQRAKGPGEPAHLGSLIRPFSVCSYTVIVLKFCILIF